MASHRGEMDGMKTDYSNARPPQWAETLLRLLLTPKDRESISGDLLEEYRDTIVPTRGRAADWWYVRQVGSFLVRASCGTALMLAVWHDPATLDAWRRSGGLEEAFIDVPVKVIEFGAAIGTFGALLGKGAARSLTTAVTSRGRV